MSERAKANEALVATVQRRSPLIEACLARGRYNAVCKDRFGRVKWTEEFDNLVTTEGKNLALDTLLAGSAYTVTGPYMGLISDVSFTAVAAGDTGAQINGTNGWTEAGDTNAPTYSGTRKTPTWDAAGSGSKALSASVAFTMTSSGTVKGVFLLLGTGALATIDDAHGTLWSAGTFAGDKAVESTDVLNISYTTSL